MRRAHEVLTAGLALALSAAPVAAQTAADIPTRPHMFLERTYFAPFSPLGKGLLFEGEAAAHYFLFNRMDWEWLREGGTKWVWPISFMPVVRMSTSASNPVLTPSYRIRPFWLQLINARAETADEKSFRFKGLGVGAMHYSNGQDRCTYQGFVRDSTLANRPCVITDSVLARRRLPNLRDGDFSTTFFPIAGYLRWGRMFDTSYQVSTQHTVVVELQVYPLGMKPGGIDRALALEYGRHQLNGAYEFETRGRCLKWFAMRRVAVKGIVRTPQDSGKVWTSSSAEWSCSYDRDGFGWFVRATLGGDYYNIHFREQANPLVTLGFIWDQGRIDYHNRAGRPAR